MTIYYAKSTNGFYDSYINIKIPKDAIKITDEIYKNLIMAQSKGQIIQSDINGNPELINYPALNQNQIIANYEFAAQENLDAVAKSWGYDSLVSAVSYANSTNPQFKAEAEALIEWRDKLWAEAYTIEAGTLPVTADAFLAMLPAAPTKPVI